MKRLLCLLLALTPAWLHAAGPLRFQAVTACRLLDTRTTSAIANGVARTVAVQGVCGVPATAVVASVNLTVLAPPSAGHLVAFTTGTTPAIPSLLFNGGETAIANGALVELAATGDGLSLLPFLSGGGTVNVLVDVTGYFQP